MTILSLDTTTEYGSVAILRDGALIEVPIHSADGFSHLIFDTVEDALAQAGIRLADVDIFAAAAGPGSFTGVRVGLTVAKGFAEAIGKPMVAVSNLRALASAGSLDRRIPILDARRGEIYTALYTGDLNLLEPEIVTSFSALLARLDESAYEFIAFADSPYRQALKDSPLAGMRWTEAPRCLAGAVARCAQLDAAAGRAIDPVAADANYVRSSDAELSWRDRH